MQAKTKRYAVGKVSNDVIHGHLISLYHVRRPQPTALTGIADSISRFGRDPVDRTFCTMATHAAINSGVCAVRCEVHRDHQTEVGHARVLPLLQDNEQRWPQIEAITALSGHSSIMSVNAPLADTCSDRGVPEKH
jgi:hypothetical protein